MRVDRRFLMVVSISLGWAAIVAGIFYRLAGGAGPRTQGEARKQIVFTVRAMPVGSTFNRDSVVLRAAPVASVPPGAYERIEDVLERPVISPIQADEPVVEARIAAKGSGIGLAPLIPPGMRAIAVRVNDVVGVAGFILPGMRVDVLVTARPPNQSDTVTRTVLQNISVLSAGQTIQTDGKSQSILTPVVTLLVNPSDAEALTLANNEGHIQLVLRNSSDGRTVATAGWKIRDMLGLRDPTAGAPRARATAAPPRPSPIVELTPVPLAKKEEIMVIMHGKESKTVTLGDGGAQ